MVTGVKIPKTVRFFSSAENGNPLEVGTGLTTNAPKSAMVYNNNSIVQLSIYDVDPYDDNPRRRRDADKWNELKESIRAVNVKKHVQVTKRPNSNKYMIASGGNSRLLILRELFEETGDEKFAKIPVQEVDFISEDDLLVQHILENEQRAEVHFWDKAVAYAKLLQRLGLHGFSLREVSERFTSLGLSISHKKIGEFLFATDHLASLGQLSIFLSSIKTVDLRKMFYDLQKTENLLQPPSESAFADFWNNQLELFAATNIDAAELNLKQLSQQVLDAHSALWPVKPTAPDLLGTSVDDKVSVAQPSIEQGVGATINMTVDDAHPAPSSIEQGQPSIAARTNPTRVDDSPQDGVPEINTIQNSLDAPSPVVSTLSEAESISTHDGLIKSVEAILEYGNLADTLRIDERFPYKFYLEVPTLDLNIQPSESENIRFFIDQRHAEARAIFWFFVELTGQFDDQHESFVNLPNESRYKRYVADGIADPIVNEEMFGLLGMPEFNTVQHWLLYGNEFFVNLVQNFFRALRAYGVNNET